MPAHLPVQALDGVVGVYAPSVLARKLREGKSFDMAAPDGFGRLLALREQSPFSMPGVMRVDTS